MNVSDAEALEAARTARLVAVIGMTDGSKPGRPSFDIPQRVKRAGARVIPVNPMIQEALGEKSYAHPKDLPEAPDIINVFRRPEAIPEVADQLLEVPQEKRARLVWLQTGISHPEAEARLEAAGYQVVSDRCLGVFFARAGR